MAAARFTFLPCLCSLEDSIAQDVLTEEGCATADAAAAPGGDVVNLLGEAHMVHVKKVLTCTSPRTAETAPTHPPAGTSTADIVSFRHTSAAVQLWNT